MAEPVGASPPVDWADREPDWIPVRDAVDRILSAVRPLEPERVPLQDTLGRVLAAPVTSPIDHPPWDNSAMDGYAARAEDVRHASRARPVRLRVVDDIPAGGFPTRSLGPGEAARIMTGAPVPDGADSVIRVEDTDRGDTEVEVRSGDDAGRNVRRRGEDVSIGDVVLGSGVAIRPAELGVLASVGCAQVEVARRPVVAILANGDELADLDEFDQVARGRKIVNSNSYMLAGAVAAAGGVPRSLGIARDDPDSLRDRLRAGLDADALVTTAGASVGEHDLMKDALEELGLVLDFWRVRMRPGSPASFGVVPRAGRPPLPVFGLPGNPVSALVTFLVLVRPALRRLQGRRNVHQAMVRVRAGERIASKPGLMQFLRVRLEPGDPLPLAYLTGPQGSAILTSLTAADALLVVPEDASGVEAGEDAVAIPLDGS